MAKLSQANQARKNRRNGKAFQTKVAYMHGGKNVGGLGGEDVEHTKFSIEAKYLQRFAGKKVRDQAISNCPEGKIPIGHIHIIGEKYENDIIMLRLEDWMNIIGSSSLKDWRKKEKEKRLLKKRS